MRHGMLTMFVGGGCVGIIKFVGDGRREKSVKRRWMKGERGVSQKGGLKGKEECREKMDGRRERRVGET